MALTVGGPAGPVGRIGSGGHGDPTRPVPDSSAPRPPGVPDAGRRALLIIGSRVAGFYLGGLVLAALLSSPSRAQLGAWSGSVLLLAVCATGVVGSLTRPVRPGTALLYVVSTGGLLLALTVGHPSLTPRDTQLLVGSAMSAAAAGAALSWGPPAGLVATTGLLAVWLGPVRASEGVVDPALFASTLAGGLLGTTGSAFLRRGYTVTQRALAAAEEAVTTRTLAAARWRARRHEIRVLHDTVLSTLSLVAQGGQGVDGPALRADCRAQARLLREADVRSTLGHDVDPAAETAPAPLPAREQPGQRAGQGADQQGLTTQAFEQLRRRWAARSLEVRLYGTDDALRLTGVRIPAASALIGALEECLENVRRHSGVSVASVSVTCSDTQLQCTVTDEGCGFDAQDTSRLRIGLGDSVVDRIREVGGEARVWSAAGQGTTVALWIPLPGEGADCAAAGRPGESPA